MRAAAAPLAAFLAVALAGCASTPSADTARWLPPLGANPVFDEAPGAAPRQRLLVTDLHLPANAVGEAHYHPWEEYLYVIEGSALLAMPGQEPRTLAAGESVIIPARQVHTPRAGPNGVRAIVTRVHDAGDPERVPAGEVEGE